jgi:uncharacterized protein
MKVIDFHVHVSSVNHWLPGTVEYLRKANPYYTEHFQNEITADEMIAILKSNNVDRAVALSEYAPESSGEATNDYVAAICKGRNELIHFGSLCLYDSTPLIEQAKYAVEVLGVKGFKLLPSYQFFYPNDPMMYPVYGYIQSLGIPVMFHTGSSVFKGTRIKYADPLLLDDVATDFPDMNITMEHGGRPFWYDRAAWLITKYENLHIGIAGMPIKNLPVYFPRMEQYGDHFIFGSDWPAMADIKGLIDRVMALPLSSEVKSLMLSGNAERILAKQNR